MLEKAFSAIDLFGIPILLNFSKSKKAQSSFGGFCSLLFLGFVIWSIYNSGYELFARQKPQIIGGTTYTNTPQPISFSSKQLPLLFGLQINNIIDPNICRYMYSTSDVKGQITGLGIMEICTSDNFDASFGDMGDASSYYCLPPSSEVPEGADLVVLMLCAFQNFTQEDFIAKSPMAMLIYPRTGLTLNSYENPVQYYFDLDFLPLTSNTTIMNTWGISHLSITTDDGWITTNEKTEQYINVESQINRNAQNNQGAFVTYTFSVSKQETYHSRSYKKIQNVLAEVGGIANTVFAVLSILVLPYARIKFSEAFVNELFETQGKKSDKTRADAKESNLEKENHHHSKSYKISTAQNEKFIKLKNLKKQIQNSKRTLKSNKDMPEHESKSGSSTQRKAPLNVNKSPRYENEGLLLQNKQCGESSDKLRLPYRKVHTQPIPSEYWLHLENSQQNDGSNQNSINRGVIRLDELIWPSETPSNYKDSNKSIINIKEEKQVGEGQQHDLEDLESRSLNLEKAEVVVEESDPQHQAQGILELPVDKVPPEDIEKQSIKNKNKVTAKLRKKESAKPKKIESEGVTISIFQYVWSFVSKSEPLKQKMIILNEGVKIMDERLDIFTLMKKLRDVDKIKGLILNKDQCFLFDRTSRPEIMSRANYWYTEENLSNEEFFGSGKDLIKDAQQRLENKLQRSEIDQKLISLFSKSE